MTVLSLLTNPEQQQQQEQQQTQTAGHENDCINSDYHRCDDKDEENINNINIGSPGTLNTTAVQATSSQPWYNQRLIIPFPIGRSIPIRPKELQSIPHEMWVEFFEQLQMAADIKDKNKDNINYYYKTTTINNTNSSNSSANIVGEEPSSRFCCFPGCSSSQYSPWFNITLMLIFIGTLVIVSLMAEEYFSVDLYMLSYLYLVGICLWIRKSRYDFDEQHNPEIQAVCNHYSPAFEERSSYYVEYKNNKTGLQFRQKMIRQLEQQQSSNNNDPVIHLTRTVV